MRSSTIKIIFLVCLSGMFAHSALGMADSDFVTITLPEKVIRQSIKNTLPLPLNPGHLEGSLVLETIDRFELEKNKAVVHGLILGKNLVLTTRIGEQDLKLNLGELRLPVTCDFTFRFDPRDKNLYITPHMADPLTGAPPEQANKVVPLLAMLNDREYPVSLANIQSFQARIGQRRLAVEMEPVDIQVSHNELVMKMVPRVSKTN